MTKGIILAGGSGSRLYPITLGVNKHLLPIYNKPMIYYPLSILMLADITDILIISSREEISRFYKILGDGSRVGINLSYKIQEQPRGLCEAFLIGKDFIRDEDVVLILGDNILIGPNLPELLKTSIKENLGATVFAYHVKNPCNFGAVKFDNENNVIDLKEKPLKEEDFTHAIIGLYIYTNDVVEKANNIQPSARSELEITDLNKLYLKEKRLKAKILSRAHIWIDAGTIDSLWEASSLIRHLENMQSHKIGAIEEIALKKGLITKKKFLEFADSIRNSEYGRYLLQIIKSY